MLENKYVSESNEQAILALILQDDGLLLEALEKLDTESFGHYDCKNIFKAVSDIFVEGNRIIKELVKSKITQKTNAYLDELLQKSYDKSNFQNHLDVVVNKSLIRKGFELSESLKNDILNPNENLSGQELLEKAQAKLDKVFEKTTSSFTTLGENLLELIPDPENYDPSQKFELKGIKSGLSQLDNYVVTFHEGCYTVIAGRPSSAKSLLLRQIFLHNRTKPMLLFSIDEAIDIIKLKMVTSITGIDYNRLKKHELNTTELGLLKKYLPMIQQMPFIIDDSPYLTVIKMRAKIKKILYKYPDLGGVGIDYVQQMQGPGNNITEQLTYISQGLKNMTREFPIPFFIISQLSRNLETRETEHEERWYDPPKMSDLRGSGALEQDLDKAIFLKAEPPKQEDGSFKEKRKTRLFIPKQRDGVAGVWVDAHVIGRLQRIEEIPIDGGEKLPF